jgi:hypothetical protein
MRVIPGHGMGVMANSSIYRGEKLMSYSPVLFVNNMIFDEFVEEDYLPLLRTGVQRLPKETRTLYMNLAGQGKGDPVDDIIDTNSFNINMFGEDGTTSSYHIVVPEIAVIRKASRGSVCRTDKCTEIKSCLSSKRGIPFRPQTFHPYCTISTNNPLRGGVDDIVHSSTSNPERKTSRSPSCLGVSL